MFDLLSNMREFARSKGLDVTWHEVRDEFSNEYDELTRYKQRRVKTMFEKWLTRKRVGAKET